MDKKYSFYFTNFIENKIYIYYEILIKYFDLIPMKNFNMLKLNIVNA